MAGQSVGEMNIVLSLNAATYSQAIDQAAKKLDQLAGKSKQIGHATVSSTQAASGALRELNGDFTNNIRAVERFITTIPGVGDALKLAFPLVGGLAFGAMLFDTGKKVYDFTQQIAKIPDSIRTGFGELNESTRKAGVELDVTNDKLGIAIAKLEHKPANLLKLALDEDRLAAANLAGEIDKAKTSIDALLEKNHVGLLKGAVSFFTGENFDETDPAEKNIRATMKKLQDAQFAAQDAEDNASPADAASVKLQNRTKLQNALTEAIVKTSSALAKEQVEADEDKFSNRQPTIDMYSGTLRQLQNQQHNFQAGNLRSDLTGQQEDLAQKKELANAAREAQRKAAEEQMKGFEEGLSQLKMDHEVGTLEENEYWSKLLAPAQKYSDNLRKVQEKLGQVRQSISRELDELGKKYEAAATKRLELQKQTDAAAIRLSDEMDRQERRSADFTAELSAVRTENADALAQMTTAHDVATGAISRHDAAVRDATAHAATYAAQLKKLDEQRAADDNDASLTPEQRDANDRGRDVQRAKIEGERDRTALQDSWNTFQTTGLGGATDALDQFIAASKDSAAQMKSFTESLINGLNDTILRQITGKGQRGDWTNLGQSVFSNIAGTALKKGEGALLSGLGISGKADGSSASPFWVKILDDASSGASATGGFLKSLFKKGSSGSDGGGDSYGGGDSGDGGGGFLSGLGDIASNIVPFLANGTDNFGGGLAVVGERGPELVNLPRGSGVIPNSKAFGDGGDTHHHTWNIDARGATDPAQVNRQIMAAAPHIAAAAVKAVHERQVRRPSSMR